jgi:hypothetical protein
MYKYAVQSAETEVYCGDDPKYALELAQMLRVEEPSDVDVVIVLMKGE